MGPDDEAIVHYFGPNAQLFEADPQFAYEHGLALGLFNFWHDPIRAVGDL